LINHSVRAPATRKGIRVSTPKRWVGIRRIPAATVGPTSGQSSSPLTHIRPGRRPPSESKTSTKAHKHTPFFVGGLMGIGCATPRGFIEPPPNIFVITTDDGILARRRIPCHGLRPTADRRGLLQRQVRKMTGRRTYSYRQEDTLADNNVPGNHSHRLRNLYCMAWRRSLFRHRSLDPFPLVPFHQILA